MVIPLADNDQRDTYLYQLVVFTGMRANAGTKSKVINKRKEIRDKKKKGLILRFILFFLGMMMKQIFEC
jgi:hypothetical protein